MGQDPSVHAIPASQRELCSENGECAFRFFFYLMWTKSVFKSIEAHGTAQEELEHESARVRACVPTHVKLKWKNSLYITQSLSTREYPKSLGQRLKLRWRTQIVSLFYPAFFFLNALRMFILLHRDRRPWRNHQSELNISPLPVITLQAGALVPRCCLESINRRCRKVTLLLQCCTISLWKKGLVTMACSTFPAQRAGAYPSVHRGGWQTQIITIPVAFSPLKGQSLHAVEQHNNHWPDCF